MRNLTLRQVLRALVIIWIANTAISLFSGLTQQIKEVRSEYSKIDPLLSDSPDIFIFGGHVTISQKTISESPKMVRKLAIRGSILRNLSWFLGRLFTLLVLINIFQILKTWNFSNFFIQENAKVIRRISLLYLGWVALSLMIYQSASFLFPIGHIEHFYNVSTINFWISHNVGLSSFSGIISSIRKSINEEALIVFFLLYILSLTMKTGVKLQKEADLTI